MAHQSWIGFAFAVALLSVPAGAGQAPDPRAARDAAIGAALERLAAGEWHPWEREPAWLALRHELNEELVRRPGGDLAALARRAAAYVDVAITPVVARRNEQLSISVDVYPRFQLDAAIPYVVEVYGSLDGGSWSRLGVFLDGRSCGVTLTTTSIWPLTLRDGLHHLDVVADISFLPTSLRRDTIPECGVPKRGRADDQPEIGIEEVIQHERRSLPGVSFGISSRLLGAPTAPAYTLEAGLPPVPITRWLNDALASVPGATPLSADSWYSEFCEPEEAVVFGGSHSGLFRRAQAARRLPRAVCITLAVSLVKDGVFSLRLRVGTVNEDAGEWSIEPPSVREVLIGGSGNVFDLPYLSMLPSLVMVPAEGLPALDVSIEPWEIRHEPADAKPGDSITITATIRNVGDRDAPYTSGMLALMSCCGSDVQVREFVEHIPVGGQVVVSLQTKMPRWGWVAVGIEAQPANAILRQPPYTYLRDIKFENNGASVEIGTKGKEGKEEGRRKSEE